MTERGKGPKGPELSEGGPEAADPEFAERFPGVDPRTLSKEDLEIWRKLNEKKRIGRKEMDEWRTKVSDECHGRHDHPRTRFLLLLSSQLESFPSTPNIYFLRSWEKK
jgi:hypothetical protein